MKRPLYNALANKVQAIHNCIKSGNAEWQERHTESVEALVKEYMPSGAGIDSGTEIDIDASSGEKLVFTTSFHHMNDVGMYDGWTKHIVHVRPSLTGGIRVSITGKNRNDIKDYLHEVFHTALCKMIEDGPTPPGEEPLPEGVLDRLRAFLADPHQWSYDLRRGEAAALLRLSDQSIEKLAQLVLHDLSKNHAPTQRQEH